MEEYITLLLEQIRCRKAHPAIREELYAHMEDQIAENMADGMTRADAENAAVKDMGNPVETGISLDRIHKPQMAWDIIGIMALITIAGNVMNGSSYFVFCSVIGFVMMLLVYRIDYTFIARHARLIAVVIMLLGISSVWNGMYRNGRAFYIGTGSIHMAVFPFMMLYVPVFGAVLYQYHGTGYRGILKALVWMLLPVLIAWRLPSLILACMLLISMLTMMSAAILQGWFVVPPKKMIAVLWTALTGLPLAMFFSSVAGMTGYQSDRLKAVLYHSGAASYLENTLSGYLHGSTLTGRSADHIEMMRALPDLHGDFVFTYFAASYGLIAGIGICILLAILMVLALRAATRQKNQLGRIMGMGSVMILFLNMLINILENTGLFPVSQTFLPFFSRGGSCAVICYMLIGIVLSVYRYRNIYSRHGSMKHASDFLIPLQK